MAYLRIGKREPRKWGQLWDPFPNLKPRGSHVVSQSAIGPPRIRTESITDPIRFGPVRPLPRQLGVEGPKGLPSENGDPYPDSWGSEAPRVCHLRTATPTSTIEAVGGGENQATAAQRRSITYIKAMHSREGQRIFAGSHPCLSDLATSSESFETARTRGQLENPASAVGDTWTTGILAFVQLADPARENHLSSPLSSLAKCQTNTTSQSLSLTPFLSFTWFSPLLVSLSGGFAEEKLYLLVAKAQKANASEVLSSDPLSIRRFPGLLEFQAWTLKKDDHSTTAAASDYYWF
ncbi:hypothetical protein PanWU01x14_132360 [Parasponia andersonii]|uniref:Uncharacterized protein n=1 Tax=Parasponia andersonii TaxID=3476 RepID=A0A2P5CQP3_PARAD|nr:hypothetical protein PanWU01x14_132360 [Parasponia andersonii]